MEKGTDGYKYILYDQLENLAILSSRENDYEKAQKILTIMVQNWPERRIAKGKVISNVNIPNPKLDTPISVP